MSINKEKERHYWIQATIILKLNTIGEERFTL